MVTGRGRLTLYQRRNIYLKKVHFHCWFWIQHLFSDKRLDNTCDKVYYILNSFPCGKHPSRSVKMGITGYHIWGTKRGSNSHGITFGELPFLCVIEVAQYTFEVFSKGFKRTRYRPPLRQFYVQNKAESLDEVLPCLSFVWFKVTNNDWTNTDFLE